MIIIRIAFLVSCLSAVILLSGCTPNMVTTPDIAVIPTGDFSLGGEIDYDGNKEYLPRTVTADASLGHPLILRYRYEVTYGRDAVPPVITANNPLTIVGFPIGADTVVVIGKLEILKGGGGSQDLFCRMYARQNSNHFFRGRDFERDQEKRPSCRTRQH